MTKKIITTYTEYDEDGKIKSQSVTETPYPEDDCDLDCECCDGAEADDNAVYQLTPKGIVCLALLRTGLVESIEDPRIDGSGSFSRQTWTHLVTHRRLKNEQSR